MFVKAFLDFFIHLDKNLAYIIQNYGVASYLILFFVIFCETGLVITPFLPGDSLIFVAGSFSSQGYFSIFLLFLVLFIAAVLGDTVNYWIGNYLGLKVLSRTQLFKKEYFEKTRRFYEKHGRKTIIIARFVPIVRTFAPFVAGIGKMRYIVFFAYNVIGGLLWVSLFLFAGFYFGNIPLVKENFTLVIFLIIFLSILPAIFEFVKSKLKKAR
jgi:membrane-associated protein